MTTRTNKKVTRLEDLEVHEVSVVDRPANLRPFLVVKSDDVEELETDEKGTLTQPASIESFAALFASLSKQFAALEASPIAKRIAVSDTVRSEAYKTASEAMRRLDTAMRTVDMAEFSENGSPEFMTLISDELADVAKLVTGLSRTFSKAPTSKRASDDLEARIVALTDDVREEIEKAGAKMAARRLNAFRDALKTLKGVFDELDPDAKKEAADAVAGKMKTTKSITVVESENVQLRKALAAATSQLTEAATKVTSLETTIKKQAGVIRSQAGARARSNVAEVAEVTKGDHDAPKTTWPLDMNNDSNRSTVDKTAGNR